MVGEREGLAVCVWLPVLVAEMVLFPAVLEALKEDVFEAVDVPVSVRLPVPLTELEGDALGVFEVVAEPVFVEVCVELEVLLGEPLWDFEKGAETVTVTVRVLLGLCVEVLETVEEEEGVAERVVMLTEAVTVALLETVEVTEAVCEFAAVALLAPEPDAVLEIEVVKEGEALDEGEPEPAGDTDPPRSAGTQRRRRKRRPMAILA